VWPGAHGGADRGGPPTSASPLARPDLDDEDDDDDAPAGLGGGGRGVRGGRDARGDDLDHEDAYDDEYDDLDDERGPADKRGSSAREWIVMISQLVVGALLGAVLWTVFSYLWQEQPVVALVLAAAATTGLVFGVRAMRRSDDLQTTVLAVVVGLVVTVSPAAIVLLSR
jgi:hypothetical protein